MNIVVLTGRLTKDPETRTTEKTTITTFTLAVDRQGDGTDYIRCVTFGKTAEAAYKYLKKGMRANVNGQIRTGSYTDKDGQKRYTTDVYVDRWEFGESKKTEENPDKDGFISIPDELDDLFK